MTARTACGGRPSGEQGPDRRPQSEKIREAQLKAGVLPVHTVGHDLERECVNLIALRKDEDGALESLDELRARLPAFLAHEASGAGLLTRVLRAMLELRAPLGLRRALIARHPAADRFAPARVLTHRLRPTAEARRILGDGRNRERPGDVRLQRHAHGAAFGVGAPVLPAPHGDRTVLAQQLRLQAAERGQHATSKREQNVAVRLQNVNNMLLRYTAEHD